jgi:cation:H+ antiporter
LIHIVLLVGSAVAIYFACEWFVNAVEWLGRRLNVGTLAVGTIFTAFGTALPESVVTFVAVVFGTTAQQKDIGVGAAMGGPLALSTIAYAVVGVTLLGQRRHPRADEFGDVRKLRRDQVWFLAIFVVKVGLGLVSFTIKAWLGLAFFAAYGVYFWRESAPQAEPATRNSPRCCCSVRPTATPPPGLSSPRPWSHWGSSSPPRCLFINSTRSDR